jgi:signal transduction histidine kinase
VGSIILDLSQKTIKLIIRDDGIGFSIPNSQSELANRGHFGLLGMKERATLIKANLSISASPGKGTTITIELNKK